jgi:hypothetical protein
MSTVNPEGSTDPEHNLTPAEIEELNRFEGITQRRLGSYLLVGNALGEIRDRHLYRASHPSFEMYVRERWGLDSAAALARACEQSLSALDADDPLGVEIRFAVRKQSDPGTPADERSSDPSQVTRSMGNELLPALRWLLTHASGTIAEIARQLENRAADIDDGARAQLRDDVRVVDGELAVVKALLLELIDWDSELRRLLEDELPPLDTDRDSDDDDD